jgi:hypothetical protein
MQSMIDSDLKLSDDDNRAFTRLARIAFILYQADAVADWLEPLSECEMPNVAAAMVQCDPVVALQSQAIFESWMSCDSPVAFLSAAAKVLSAWESVPEPVQAQREELLARIRGQLANLAAIDIESEIDVEFFKFDEMTAFFRSVL